MQGGNQNADWNTDIEASVADYNRWFLAYTSQAFSAARVEAAAQVRRTFRATRNLTQICPSVLTICPRALPVLRMMMSPPWAVDRLVGITGVRKGLVTALENGETPRRMTQEDLRRGTTQILRTILENHDRKLFPWVARGKRPTKALIELTKQILTDRLAQSRANPDIRNAQEARQLATIEEWLTARNYVHEQTDGLRYDQMLPGTFRFRMNIPGRLSDDATVNVPVDAVVMPRNARRNSLPTMIECKSAGDFANVNKRRKEEAAKHQNLRNMHGQNLNYVLYLSGYFNKTYLEYEQNEGIRWVWHHRPDDLTELGL